MWTILKAFFLKMVGPMLVTVAKLLLNEVAGDIIKFAKEGIELAKMQTGLSNLEKTDFVRKYIWLQMKAVNKNWSERYINLILEWVFIHYYKP